MPEAAPPVVAIFDPHPAMCDVLSLILEAEGWRPVTANLAAFHHDVDAICAFLTQHQPQVVIFDIAPPYAENWQVFTRVRTRSALSAAFILTTTNKRHLEALVGRISSIEIISKPFALERIVQAVHLAIETTTAAQ